VIHFDLNDRYQDENVVGSAISRREGVVASVVFHVLLAAALIYVPQMPFFELSPEELARREAEMLERLQDEPQRFVFVQPRLDMPAPQPPPQADLSDMDRQAQSPLVAPQPTNPEPAARGNTPERIDEPAVDSQRARGDDVEPTAPQPETQIASALPPSETSLPRPRPAPTPPPRVRGDLGEALRNLQQFIEGQTFDNPQGQSDRPGATIQFDTKGVEFGPWLRRFVAQVRRNWLIPQAAMILSGRVVLQFNIHKDGRITDVNVVGPSPVEAFNRAAQGAILASNPTEPLPPEYPADRAFFTVTFYYNERP
jgi:TonB family protein